MKSPITRLDVPALKESIDHAVDHVLGFWAGRSIAFDPMNPKHAEFLKKSLADVLLGELRLGLKHAAKRACEQALDHVWALMRDPDYQLSRSERQKRNAARQKEREAKRRVESKIDREFRRQVDRGIVQ